MASVQIAGMGILTERKIWRREKWTRKELTLTAEQQENVRRTARVLIVKFGSTRALAAAMKMKHAALQKALSRGRARSMRFAIAVAYAGGMRVEDVIGGTGTCPYCGRD